MTNTYRDEALRTAQICASHWNREPASPSYGCFDRQYWGWKKKDFPDAALQAAVTLCVRLAEHRGAITSLPALLAGYVGYLERMQHRDGSFDQFYPNEKAPGVVHDLLSALIWLFRSPHVVNGTKQRLETIIQRSVAYALKADERHGNIANHFAQYAWEFIHLGHVFGHAAATQRGQDYLGRTLALFDPVEGWFQEYDGPDAGYQTRLLAFLTRIADLKKDAKLWDVCARAARFVEAMLMPDGSLHPMLGVRSTALVYPSGFERLAARDPAMVPLADRIHESWIDGVVPLPSSIDLENAIRVADDAFQAAEMLERRKSQASPSLEAHSQTAAFDLPNAGLHRRTIAGGEQVLYVASKLGGTIVLYARGADTIWRLVYENAGYLLHLSKGDTRWLVRFTDAGRVVEQSDHRLVVEAAFQRSLHDEMTPFRMIILRILNLTVLRFQRVGDVFRKLVVRHLIADRQGLPIGLRRELVIGDCNVEVIDKLVADPLSASSIGEARLYRCRRVTGTHMASARYFQPQELTCNLPWREELPTEVLDGRPLQFTLGRNSL